uniref:Uncharacterized protein n=1 Tax=Setaria viridis TaxID=4556 RepID=A0A4U6TJY1_SETVI|nr:hypothetical protein SEVIR_9G510350v2 [Setaria viridis]
MNRLLHSSALAERHVQVVNDFADTAAVERECAETKGQELNLTCLVCIFGVRSIQIGLLCSKFRFNIDS